MAKNSSITEEKKTVNGGFWSTVLTVIFVGATVGMFKDPEASSESIHFAALISTAALLNYLRNLVTSAVEVLKDK